MKQLPTTSSEPLIDTPLPPADQHAGALAALGRLRKEARRQISKLGRSSPCPQVSTGHDEPADRSDVLPSTDKPSRRNVMGMMGTAAATTVGATLLVSQSAAAFAIQDSSREGIDALYEQRTELAAQSRELREQHNAAEASMPWWAQPGPSHLRGDGSWWGTDVGWPAIDNDRFPSFATAMLLKRPSPSDIRKDFEFGLRTWGEKHRPEIRAAFRRRMRDLVARIRRQREEELRVGLPAIEAQLEQLGEIDEKIENLSVTPAGAAQKAAAMILITSLYDHWRNTDCFGNTATLVALQPFLTGQIREHVDYVIAHPDHEMWAMPFYSAA
jgi:hypothetical protein